MEERFSWIPFYKQAQKGQEPLRPRGSIHSAWKLQRSRAGFAAPIMSSEEHPSYYSPKKKKKGACIEGIAHPSGR